MRYRFALPVRRRWLVPIPLLALALALPADASKPRLRLERIDASAFADESTVRVFASVVELEGSVDDGRATPAFILKMDGKNLGRPLKMQPFSGAGEPLDLVLVIESSALYGPKKIVVPPPPPPSPKGKRDKPPKGKQPAQKGGGKGNKIARDVLSRPSPPATSRSTRSRTRCTRCSRGCRRACASCSSTTAPTSRRIRPSARPARPSPTSTTCLPDGDAGDLALSQAIRAALTELGKPRPDAHLARRLILVISDGLNSQMDRKTFKTLGDAAARARVPIHTIAFSPTDERGPLLNLGEISKRSNGTFRWAKTADDLRAQIDTLTDELNKQYVLTYKIDARSLEGHTFTLQCEDLTSNPLVYDSSGGVVDLAPATKPLIPWWLWALVGLVVFGGGAAIIVARRPRAPKKQMKFSPYKNAGGPPTGQQPAAQPQQPAAGARRATGAAAARADARPAHRRVRRARRSARRRRRRAGDHRQGPVDDSGAGRPGRLHAPRRGREPRRHLRRHRPRLDERHLRQQHAHRPADAPR